MTKNNLPDVIFFGNGPLADATFTVLKEHTNIIFHARTKEDLETVKQIKAENPSAHGVLASFGVMIKSDVLDIFEPEGILNIHPSLLPLYRGASPIESAILNGDTTLGVSVMKLVKAMDAGPLYYQTSKEFDYSTEKFDIYTELATLGTEWICNNLENLPAPTKQDDSKATFTTKFDTSMSELHPESESAQTLLNKVRAFQKFPKARYQFFGLDCIIIKAHISPSETPLALKCQDGQYLAIDTIQPAGKRAMDAKSFCNGYKK